MAIIPEKISGGGIRTVGGGAASRGGAFGGLAAGLGAYFGKQQQKTDELAKAFPALISAGMVRHDPKGDLSFGGTKWSIGDPAENWSSYLAKTRARELMGDIPYQRGIWAAEQARRSADTLLNSFGYQQQMAINPDKAADMYQKAYQMAYQNALQMMGTGQTPTGQTPAGQGIGQAKQKQQKQQRQTVIMSDSEGNKAEVEIDAEGNPVKVIREL